MSLSKAAINLAKWLNLYKLGGSEYYNNNIANKPKVNFRGAFREAIFELIPYEAANGYFPYW